MRYAVYMGGSWSFGNNSATPPGLVLRSLLNRGLRGAKTAPLAPGYSLSARGGKLGFRDRNYTS